MARKAKPKIIAAVATMTSAGALGTPISAKAKEAAMVEAVKKAYAEGLADNPEEIRKRLREAARNA